MSPERKPRRGPAKAADARARILDAAEAELGARGFVTASTNAVAEAAGVAKGLVFHYFGSKTELFLAVLDRVTERVIESYLTHSEPWPADLFERLYAISMHKIRLFQRDRDAYRVLAMLTDAPDELRDVLLARAGEVRRRIWPKLLAGVDTSCLRPGVSLDAALETIVLLGEGLERRIIAQVRELPDHGASQMESILRDVWKHYERLRDGLYRT
jgi:AcrR family transcriptional regulator